MKRFILPFIIALFLHVALLWGNFDFLKKDSVKPPEIEFMTMTLTHVEAPSPVKKPKKKIVEKKKIKPAKKILKKKLIPEPEISKIAEEKKEELAEEEKEVNDEKEAKGATSRVKKASPHYSFNPSPSYPKSARKRGWQGIVELLVVVDKHGNVRSLKIYKSSGFKILDRSALKTVKSWRFSPGRKGNEPVETEVIVPVNFSLTS